MVGYYILCNATLLKFSSFFSLSMSVSSVHFCAYKEKFISLYCRLSSVLDLDALITQQALREAITDTELSIAKQRHQHVLDYIQVFPLHTGLPPHSDGVNIFFLYFHHFVTRLWLRHHSEIWETLHWGDGMAVTRIPRHTKVCEMSNYENNLS